MNRRNFLKMATLAVSSTIFLPRSADAFRWNTSRRWVKKNLVYRINPAWINAPYEVGWCVDDMAMPAKAAPIVLPRGPESPGLRKTLFDLKGRAMHDAYPMRLGADSNYIPPLIESYE